MLVARRGLHRLPVRRVGQPTRRLDRGILRPALPFAHHPRSHRRRARPPTWCLVPRRRSTEWTARFADRRDRDRRRDPQLSTRRASRNRCRNSTGRLDAHARSDRGRWLRSCKLRSTCLSLASPSSSLMRYSRLAPLNPLAPTGHLGQHLGRDVRRSIRRVERRDLQTLSGFYAWHTRGLPAHVRSEGISAVSRLLQSDYSAKLKFRSIGRDRASQRLRQPALFDFHSLPLEGRKGSLRDARIRWALITCSSYGARSTLKPNGRTVSDSGVSNLPITYPAQHWWTLSHTIRTSTPPSQGRTSEHTGHEVRRADGSIDGPIRPERRPLGFR